MGMVYLRKTDSKWTRQAITCVWYIVTLHSHACNQQKCVQNTEDPIEFSRGLECFTVHEFKYILIVSFSYCEEILL